MDMNMSDAGKTGQVTASSNQYAGMMLHSGFTETIIFQGWKTQYPGGLFIENYSLNRNDRLILTVFCNFSYRLFWLVYSFDALGG
jgi:hypothetical protein